MGSQLISRVWETFLTQSLTRPQTRKIPETVKMNDFRDLLVRPAGFEPATYGFEDRDPELSNLLKLLQLIEITCFPFSRSFPILAHFSRFWELFLTWILTQQIGAVKIKPKLKSLRFPDETLKKNHRLSIGIALTRKSHIEYAERICIVCLGSLEKQPVCLICRIS